MLTCKFSQLVQHATAVLILEVAACMYSAKSTSKTFVKPLKSVCDGVNSFKIFLKICVNN